MLYLSRGTIMKKKFSPIVVIVFVGFAALLMCFKFRSGPSGAVGSESGSGPIDLGEKSSLDSLGPIVASNSSGVDEIEEIVISAPSTAAELPLSQRQSLFEAFLDAQLAVQIPSPEESAREQNEGIRYFVSNSSQRMTARFSNEGALLQAAENQREWSGLVKASAAGRGGSVAALSENLEPVANGNRVEYRDSGVVEWFENTPAGIEHGLTLTNRPSGDSADGPVRVDVSAKGLWAKQDGDRVVLLDPSGAETLSYEKLKTWDANGVVLESRMEASATGGISIFVADAGAAYPITIDPLFVSLVAKLGPDELDCGKPGDLFGHAVGIFGDLAAVGVPGDDNLLGVDAGGVFLFQRVNGVWTLLTKLKASDGRDGDRFGGDVAVNADCVLVGARLADLGSRQDVGAVYTFCISRGMWMQRQKVFSKRVTAGEWFGESISMAGDLAIVGAPTNGDGEGSAYVFGISRQRLSYLATLELPKGFAGAGFGESVSILGSLALVGAPNVPTSAGGAAYIFSGSGSSWSLLDTLTPPGAMDPPPPSSEPPPSMGESSLFGASVALAPGCAYVGAPHKDTDDGGQAGAVYVFAPSADEWLLSQELFSTDPLPGGFFGTSLSAFGKLLAIGAPGEDTTVSGSGAAYLFGPSTGESGLFPLDQLVADNPGMGDFFGGSVAMSGSTILVGAFLGDPMGYDESPVIDRGCVYVFDVFGSDTADISISSSENPTDDEVQDGSLIDFGTVVICTSSTRSYTIRNAGATPLDNLNFRIQGSNSRDFSFAETPPASLAPGAQFTLGLVFAPMKVGSKTAELRVTSNDSDEGTIIVQLVGVGDPATSPQFEQHPTPDCQLVESGSRVNFNVSVVGEPEPTVQWKFNNRVIRGRTGSRLSLVADLSSAGSYSVEASNKAGRLMSNPGILAVVDTSVTEISEACDRNVKMQVSAAGPDLQFQWLLNGSPLVLDSNMSISNDGKTLTISRAQPEQSGNYSCRVSNECGSLVGGIHYLSVYGEGPSLTSFELPSARLNCPYEFEIPYQSGSIRKPDRFAATGLPRGLSIDRDTGLISGVPTGTGSSSHNVRITVSNLKGSETVEKSMSVIGLPCGLIGTFVGTVDRDGFVNGGHGGCLNLTVLSSGSYTGVLDLGPDTYRFSGILEYCDESYSSMESTVRLIRKVGRGYLPSLDLSLLLDPYSGCVTGSVTDRTQAPWEFSPFVGSPYDSGSDDGKGTDALFNCPIGMGADKLGNIYIADQYNHVIRRSSPLGVVVTLAGSVGVSGYSGGCGPEAQFNGPTGVAADFLGFVYVCDTGNHVIRRVTPEGKVTLYAGQVGVSGTDDGAANEATFVSPTGICLAPDGSLYVADSGAHTVRKISPSGVVTTVAGLAGNAGAVDGPKSRALFDQPYGLCLVSDDLLVVADAGNHCLRGIDLSRGSVSTFAGALAVGGDADGPVANARFCRPMAVSVSNTKDIFVADLGNRSIRKVSRYGLVSTVTDACFADARALEVSIDTSAWLPTQEGPSPYCCLLDQRYPEAFYGPMGVLTVGAYLYVSDCYQSAIYRGRSGQACGAGIIAKRNPWGNDSSYPESQYESCFSPPATNYAGDYVFILDPCYRSQDKVSTVNTVESQSEEDCCNSYPPEGNGFGSLTINTNGTVRYTLKLADGTSVTGSSILGGNYYDLYNAIPICGQMLYRDTGSVQGWLQVQSNYWSENTQNTTETPTSESCYGNLLYGCLDWYKISQTNSRERNYRCGFPLHGLSAMGEQIVSTSAPDVIGMSFPQGSNNADLYFYGGGLIPGFSQWFTLNSNGSVDMPTGSNNPNSVSFSFSASTRQFNGRFTLTDSVQQMSSSSTVTRRVDYFGVWLCSIGRGAGYFLLEGLPYYGETSSTTPIWSGQVTLEPNQGSSGAQ